MGVILKMSFAISEYDVYCLAENDMENQKQLLKGSTQTLILALLRDQPRHGYAIAREIERRSDHGVLFHDSTLYPALKKLENDGLIVGAWETWDATDNNPPRKSYRLTEVGVVELEKRLTNWSQFVRAINAILGVTPDPKPELNTL